MSALEFKKGDESRAYQLSVLAYGMLKHNPEHSYFPAIVENLTHIGQRYAVDATSMHAHFSSILKPTDECWCGSTKQFGQCHGASE